MKRFYVILVLAIAIALALAVGISKHTGYVLITYPHVLHYESSLWATLFAVFAIILAIYLVRLLLSLVTTSGGVVNPWSRRNRSRRVQIAIEQGQMDLAEGRWASAERHLHRAAEAERDWVTAQAGDAAALKAYIDRYPGGPRTAEAQAALDGLARSENAEKDSRPTYRFRRYAPFAKDARKTPPQTEKKTGIGERGKNRREIRGRRRRS